MNKSRVIETLDSLPEEFNTEELIEKLLFIEKVERARQEVAQGKTMLLEDAKHRFESKWEAAK